MRIEMKVIIGCLFLVVLTFIKARNSNSRHFGPVDTNLISDSFSKFSYLLIGKENRPDSGNIWHSLNATCFFVRRNGKLLLVTARHAVVNKDLNPPCTYLVVNGINKDEWFPFYFFESNHLPKIDRLIHPDVYAFQISEPRNCKVNSIEHLIEWSHQDYKLADTGLLFSYHFPKYDSLYRAGKCVLTIDSDPQKWLKYNNTDKIDSFHYDAKIISGKPGPGSSGGPVFMMKNGKYVFAGICVGPSGQGLHVLRPEYVISEIEKKVNRPR